MGLAQVLPRRASLDRRQSVGRDVLDRAGEPVGVRSYISAAVNHGAAEAAADPDGADDALQASECSREDLAAMLATLDRSTVAGQRDALALTLAWYMTGRASEPSSLNIRDVAEDVV
ncbi:hypothetical protein ACFRFU_52910 [Streptomyces sp. NPDC056704]|uniref:hypothetical protein n=1 Tax=Streptomyces sp. NPDC056704 TaxID=3345917 RepID=UPI0036C40713